MPRRPFAVAAAAVVRRMVQFVILIYFISFMLCHMHIICVCACCSYVCVYVCVFLMNFLLCLSLFAYDKFVFYVQDILHFFRLDEQESMCGCWVNISCNIHTNIFLQLIEIPSVRCDNLVCLACHKHPKMFQFKQISLCL